MNVIPKAAPTAPALDSSGAQDARARAIAKLTQAPSQPQVNQNSISPEEMTAVRPPSRQAPALEATEAQIEEVQEEKAKEDPMSTQYAILARKEKALRAKAQQQEQALKSREEALKAREEAIALKDKDYESNYISKQRLKSSPLEALMDAEVSYDELTQQVINNQTPLDPRIKSMLEKAEAKIAKLEAEVEQSKAGAQEQQSQAYQSAIKQITQDVEALVKSDEAYEAIRSTRSTKDVVELIELTFKEEGRVMAVEEAAALVEDHLLSEIDKLTRIEKVKRRLSPPVATADNDQVQTPAKPAQQKQPMTTLTNANSSSRKMSARERALLAFKGQLK